MQAWPGIAAARHSDPQLRNDLIEINRFLYEVSSGVARLGKGLVPTSSGGSISTVLNLNNLYLYKPNVVGGQTLAWIDTSNPALTISAGTAGNINKTLFVVGTQGIEGLEVAIGTGTNPTVFANGDFRVKNNTGTWTVKPNSANVIFTTNTAGGWGVQDQLECYGQLHVLGQADRLQVKINANTAQTLDLIEWQTSAGVVLSAITSAGNYKLVSGATAGYVLTSDVNGVGSWAAAAVTTVDAIRTWSTLQTFKDTTFKLVDDADASKTLIFELGSSTANADLTLDYRSLVDRSLIWNLSGGTGGNLTITWAGTASRTITLPSSASTTLAGLAIAQNFTKTQTISATTGNCLVLNESPDNTTIVKVIDASLNQIFDVDSGNGVECVGVSLWPTGIGSGFRNTFISDTLSANHNAIFPDITGKVVTVGNDTDGSPSAGTFSKVNRTAQSAAITAQTTTNGQVGYFLVHYTLEDTTADLTAGTIQFQINYTDDIGATTQTGATLALTATGRDRGSFHAYVASGNITYQTNLVGIIGTSRYALRVRLEYLG